MAKILLIEPDRLLAQTYHKALSSEGHSVVVCAGAQSAIRAADESMPEIVVLELQLVGHSGIEFLYEFRSYADWQDIPILINTIVPPGEFTSSEALLKKELGVSYYLYKPRTNLRELLNRINEFTPVEK